MRSKAASVGGLFRSRQLGGARTALVQSLSLRHRQPAEQRDRGDDVEAGSYGFIPFEICNVLPGEDVEAKLLAFAVTAGELEAGGWRGLGIWHGRHLCGRGCSLAATPAKCRVRLD